MKKLVLGLALAAVTAVPALAAGSTWESWNTPGHDRNAYMQERSMRSAYVAEPGYGAYAAAPMDGQYMAAPGMSVTPPVIAYGEYQGNDPDPFIRQSLMRDPPATNSQY